MIFHITDLFGTMLKMCKTDFEGNIMVSRLLLLDYGLLSDSVSAVIADNLFHQPLTVSNIFMLIDFFSHLL